MKLSKGVIAYSVSLIMYGAYILVGVGSYHQFARFFLTLHTAVPVSAYLFNVLYGICCIYCGMRIMKGEEWARVLVLVLTAVSVVAGFLLNRTVMENFRYLLYSGQLEAPSASYGTILRAVVTVTIALTLYELSVIFFFTRTGVKEQFRRS